MNMSEDTTILDALSEMVKVASAKSATQEPPSSAPAAKDDSETKYTKGPHAATDEADAKKMAGPTGVEATSGTTNPESYSPTAPAQEALNPGTSEQKPETKPDVVTAAGSDSDTSETLKEASSIAASLEAYIKEAAIVPQVEKTYQQARVEMIDKSAAQQLQAAEDACKDIIARYLAANGLDESSGSHAKRAAVVSGVISEYDLMADGFILSCHPDQMQATIKRAAEDVVGDMPQDVPMDEGAAAGAVPPDEGAAAGAVPPDESGVMDIDPQILQEIVQLLQQVEAGEITPEQLLVALQELGVPDEVLMQIAQELDIASQGAAEAAPPEISPEKMAKVAAWRKALGQ